MFIFHWKVEFHTDRSQCALWHYLSSFCATAGYISRVCVMMQHWGLHPPPSLSLESPPLASLAAFQMPRGSFYCHLHHLLLLTLFCSPWVICTWRRRQRPIYAIVPSDPLPPFSQPLREVAVSWNGHHGCAVWWNISVKWSECVIQRRGQDLRMGWSRLA